MKSNRTLWRIPAFGIVAGYVWFWLNVSILGRLTTVQLPDGAYTVDPLRSLLLYVFVLAVTVAVAALWITPKMTRREVAASSAILVAFYLAGFGIQMILQRAGAVMLTVSIGEAYEWTHLLSQLLYLLAGTEGPWLWVGSILECFAPLLLIPFGKKELPDDRA